MSVEDEYQAIHTAAVNAYLELCDQDEECVCEDCVVRTILENVFARLCELARAETTTSVDAPKLAALEGVDPALVSPHRLV